MITQRLIVWIIAALFAIVALVLLFGSSAWAAEPPEPLITPDQEPVVMPGAEQWILYMPIAGNR